MKKGIGIRNHQRLAPSAFAVFLLAAALLTAGPATASLRSFFADAGAGGTYTCGSPAIGMRGTLNLAGGPATCLLPSTLEIPAVATTIATFYSSTVFNPTRTSKVRGNELYVDLEADTPGEVVFEFGYGASIAGFSPIGSVRVNVDWTRNPQGHRVDLSAVWGQVPANMYLAMRISKSGLSPFRGRLYLHNMPPVGGPILNSIRGSVYEGTWTVGKALGADYPTIATAVAAAAVLAGDRLYLQPDTYSGAGFTGVDFGAKSLMLIGEEGAENTIIDCGYANWAFRFSSGVTDSGGLEGLTIRRANQSSVLVIGTAYPVIRNCIFRENDSTASGGGAIFVNQAKPSWVLIEGCTFVGNRYAGTLSTHFGGAIVVGNDDPATTVRATITGCTFVRNASNTRGGAIAVNAALANVTIAGCTFIDNAAPKGGAISAQKAGTVSVSNCRFTGNLAEQGGAVHSEGIRLANCTFTGNEADTGGAVYFGEVPSAPGVINHCTLTGNHARGRAGGVYVFYTTVYLVNSVLWGNTHDNPYQGGLGKELFCEVGIMTNAYVGNCDIEGGIDGMHGIKFSAMEGIHLIDGGNIMNLDPLLATAEAPLLLPGSPCIDQAIANPTLPAGTAIPASDIEGVGNGVSRGLSACAAGAPDLGAYEHHGDCGAAVPVVTPFRLEVSGREGGSPPDAVTLSVRNAAAQPLRWRVTTDVAWITVRPPAEGETAEEADTVRLVFSLSVGGIALAPGEHRGTVQLAIDPADPVAFPVDSPRTIEVLLHVTRERHVPSQYANIQEALNVAEDGDEVIVADGDKSGVGNRSLTTRSKSLLIRSANGADTTAIVCEGDQRGITVPLSARSVVTLQGFTIRDCNGSGTPREGGGLWIGPFATVRVLDSSFKNNVLQIDAARTKGGGIYSAGTTLVSKCEFDANDADYGGGVYQASGFGGDMVIRDSQFTNNVAGWGGGAYLAGNTSSLVLGSTFTSNASTPARAAVQGGGIYASGSNILIEGCLFKSNGYSGVSTGGGVYMGGTGNRLASSVFANNNAGTGNGGGVYLTASATTEVANCTLRANTANLGGGLYVLSGTVVNVAATGNTTSGAGSEDILPSLANVYSSFVDNGYTLPDANGNFDGLAQFVDVNTDNFRLRSNSDLIDRGRTVDWLFSDRRGSVRAIDGDDNGTARFDVGAYEYSRYYGGIFEDGAARAFRDLAINGAVVATGYEYRVQWKTKSPFPEQMDERVEQAGEYEARLLLVNDAGNYVELGTWVMRLGPQYTIPYTFRAEHIGEWRLRLEMASDPNQYALSAPFSIQYKDLVIYYLGKEIAPPAGALAGQKPDVDYPDAVYWSTETNRLYAIAPYPVQLTWYEDRDRTIPLLVMGMNQTPLDPQFHVADAPPVVLRPEGTRFGAVSILWSDSSASISSDRFNAPQDGWTTLLFRDSVNADPELRELFTVVRTLTWNHRGTQTAQDPYYPGPPPEPPPLPPVDPTLPIEKTKVIGELILDPEHDMTGACSGGHVLNELAPYDGAGDDRAYDRPTRSGQIFAVNDDVPNSAIDPSTEDDDLVVIWYRRQGDVADGDPGVCWPFKPVRYDPAWPAPSVTCPGDPPGNCNRIEIAGALIGDTRIPVGSGALPPDTFGAWDNMVVYNQPDRRLPGFNPNEEHALLFPSQGTPYPGAFPLRSDLNRFAPADWTSVPVRYTSAPYVLLKHRDPVSGEWRFKVFFVTPGTLTYTPEAGNEFNPPYPLNQFVFGPCRDRAIAGHDGTWTDAVPYKADGTNMSIAEALVDKDKKLFFYRGGVTVKAYNFYRMQAGFWLDLDNNGVTDKPPGTCLPLLDGWDPVSQTYVPFDGKPAPITNNVVWPATPTLYVGETLADAKMQSGETVGLPNVKDQCIVAKLWDEAGVRLFDPLREWTTTVDLIGEIETLKTDPPPGTGTNVKFRDLPPQLQGRITYDDVNKVLKLKGEYVTTTGEPVLMLNTLSTREFNGIETALVKDPVTAQILRPKLRAALLKLKQQGDANLAGVSGQGQPSIARWEADFKAVSAGNVDNTGFVTLAFNNHVDCPAPTMLSVIEVDCPLYRGDLKVVESSNPFEEKLTLRHNGDFGGKPDDRYFEWAYLQGYSGIPEGPGTEGENWLPFNPANSSPGPTDGTTKPMPDAQLAYRGLVDITPKGTGQQLLPDRWFAVRYYYRDSLNYHPDPPENAGGVCTMVSPWTPPQLAEGWVKRVMKKINLFDQRVKNFHTTDADTVASMIAQAGRSYEGDVALSDEPGYLKRVGLIELYQTLMNRALALSVDADPPDPSLRDAVLFAANRLASLHMLLGNEAYADSADPTVGFGTQDGQYGSMASSIFAFQNQMDTLLDEELALLEGRDDAGIRPFYNRLPWNFTIADGEVAYRQVYNIQDVADSTGAMSPDGEINEYDAKFLFPQGHGDAWGHYLNAIKKLYYLVTHDAVDAVWVPTVEAILVAQAPVEVDYRDERLFATAAAARARAGADIVNLTYRRFYDEDPQKQWQSYRDSNPTRAWGLAEWASRAGQGAYIDWAVGNALLPSVSTTIRKVETFPAPAQARYVLGADYARGVLEVWIDDNAAPLSSGYTVTPVYDQVQAVWRTRIDFAPVPAATMSVRFIVGLPAEGIKKVDRTTVVDLHEIAAQYDAIQSTLDQADAGLNPLGVAKDTVPFDIDPTLVAAGQTHFEQIYNRALQALQNTATVFDYASQSSQMLRRQQDRLDDFKRTIADREADFTSRLVEVFGYPYPEDCGPGKLYPTGYCATGPDLYHYMYVDPSYLMGDANTDKNATTAPRELQFTVNFRDLAVDEAGGLTEREVPVDFTVDEDRRFGIIRPGAWTGNRRAPGALQLARADLLQLRGRFERAMIEYDTLIGQVEDQADLIKAQYNLNSKEIFILQEAKGTQQSLNDSILNGRNTAASNRATAQDVILVANLAMEAIPKVIGLATDAMSALRGIALGVGQGLSLMYNQMADDATISELSSQQAKEIAGAEANIRITTKRGEFAVLQQTLQLENLVRREAVLRQELYTLVEGLHQSAGRFLNGLAAGERILEERLRFRKQTAAQVQDYRYTDMTFRVFRNDALQKYKAQLDLAGRYAYLAAKAYDYETTLLDASSMAGRAFLSGIVKERSIGTVLGGQPLTGTGLADVLRRLSMNFQVLKPQLGFNNPQVETNRFSLRRELFRVRFDAGSDETWRNALAGYQKDDLWEVPEFRRYCRPFGAQGVAEPGLVIPFRTTVTAGLNFFGWPLGGGDSYYSASNFATKVRSVGVWFSNYNATGLAQTPRVYLVPAGEDVLRSPTGNAGDIRSWHVLDQKLPAPQLINTREMANDPGWIPAVNTVLDEFGAARRHSDFKAYHDSGYLEPTEMTYDTRLIGRSVWNTKWMLIIPGRNLLYDPGEGLEMFVNGPEVYGGAGERSGNGISDIKLFFTTYAYSGN